MKTIRLRTSKKALYQQLRAIPRELSGRRTETDMNRIFLNHLAYNLFGVIKDSFDDKSAGGTDDFGKKWEPLTQETIAQRPITNEEYRRAAVRQGERGILTVMQNRVWKAIFRSHKARLIKQGIQEAKAEGMAAELAWVVIKKQGGKTKLNVFGKRKVKINRVTDRLYDSLCPGTLTGNRYYPPHEQVFKVENGDMTLGTSVPYAGAVSKLRPVIPTATDIKRSGILPKAIKSSTASLVDELLKYFSRKFR